MFDVRHEIQH